MSKKLLFAKITKLADPSSMTLNMNMTEATLRGLTQSKSDGPDDADIE